MKFNAIVCGVLCLVFLLGCATQEPGIYKKGGAYYEWTHASVDDVHQATLRALPELDLIVTGGGESNTQVRALNRYGTVVTVYITEDDGATSYGVEVDPGQSEGYSQTILNAIRRQLGQSDHQ